jgi:hypothetical protein
MSPLGRIQTEPIEILGRGKEIVGYISDLPLYGL